uniref:RHS repeat-associated core domain-containing protein n=1 Tax=Chitinilyticum litopenaei TaxID=1121276 RepID=UPI001FE17E23
GELDEPQGGEHQPLRFPGQYHDSESGLHYNTFRYYDPESGRYLSPDPIGLAGGLHLYGYVPDPNGWMDPWGWAIVDAIFEMGGQIFTGTNPTDRAPRTSGPTSPGLRGPNTNTFDMHAEIEAMSKAKDAGLSGGKGTLTITGKDACPYCKGDIKTMARTLGLDELTVHNNGRTIKFTKQELNTIKQGGKGWKC